MKKNGIYRLRRYLIVLILILPFTTTAVENGSNTTPLHTAIAESRNSDVKRLIQQGANVNALNKWGMTPIFSAGSRKNLEGAKILLENGASLNITNQDGETPIFWAVKGGSAEIVQFYLDNNAQLNIEDNEGDSPLNIAVRNYYRGYQQKHVHTKRVRSELIDTLIENGADVNAIDSNGENILHYVAVNGDSDTLRLLLTLSADPDIIDSQGHTPLDHAQMFNNSSAVALLSSNTEMIQAGIIGSPYRNITSRLSSGICKHGSVEDFNEAKSKSKYCVIELKDNLGLTIEGVLFVKKSEFSGEVDHFSFMYSRKVGQTRQTDIALLKTIVDTYQPELSGWIESREFLVKFGENSREISGDGFRYTSGGDSSGWSIRKGALSKKQQSNSRACPKFAFYGSHDVNFFRDHWVSKPVGAVMPGSPVAEISFTKYNPTHVLFSLRISEDSPLSFDELGELNAEILLETGKIDIADFVINRKSVDFIITMESFRDLKGVVGFELSDQSRSKKYMQVGFQAGIGLSPIYEAAENHWGNCWGGQDPQPE